MKTLYLLRHATAAHATPGQGDQGRPLSAHGLTEAAALGEAMRAQNLVPDGVLCSPALRTRQTLANALGKDADAALPAPLYNATAGALLHAAAETGDDARTLLLIAHNPGIHMLVHMLAAPDDPALARMGDYPPGTLAALELPTERWAQIAPGTGRIATLLVPGQDYGG